MSKLRRRRPGRTRSERIAARIVRWHAFALEHGVRLPELSPTGYPPVGWTMRVLYRPQVVQARLYSASPLLSLLRSRHG